MKTCTLLAFALLAACSSSSGDDADTSDGGSKPDGSSKPDASHPRADAFQGSGGVAAIPLTTPDQSFWSPVVTVGGQDFVMDIDTGSTTLGVAGSTCTTCNVTPKYTPGSGATDDHHTASTTYEDNSGWSGEVYTDTVTLGNGTPTVTMAFADMKTQTQFFYDGNSYQGILGLGPTILAEPHTDAYFDKLVAAGEPSTMAFELCDDGGTMWLGGFDESHGTTPPQYTPMLPFSQENAWYAVAIDGISIGSASVASGSATFNDPIIDTGTTLFYLPTTVYNSVRTAVQNDTGFKSTFGQTAKFNNQDCVTKAGVTNSMVDANLPAFTFKLPSTSGGADISVSAKPVESYLYDYGNGEYCLSVADSGSSETILGDAIIRAFVTVIDEQNQQIGFAPDAGCTSQFQAHRAIDRTKFRPHHPPRPGHHRTH